MADETVKVPGTHYSGQNKIPTVNQFLERLDKDKRERDKAIDEENKQKTANKSKARQDGDAIPHQEQKFTVKGSQKQVKDPTTGKDVVIEDVNKDMMESVRNPMVYSTVSNQRQETLMH